MEREAEVIKDLVRSAFEIFIIEHGYDALVARLRREASEISPPAEEGSRWCDLEDSE